MQNNGDKYGKERVTPCAGVWIEIPPPAKVPGPESVTPCAGVWIEISWLIISFKSVRSLPVRECGLKS